MDTGFDGDTSSANVVYSKEAMAEVSGFLKTRKAYVGTDGEFLYPIGTDTVSIVMANMTGDPRVPKPMDYRLPDSAKFTMGKNTFDANKILSKLIVDQTRPILLNKLQDTGKFDSAGAADIDDSYPILIAEIGPGTNVWAVLDGNKRVAKAKQEGKHWLRAYVATPEMLAAAVIK